MEDEQRVLEMVIHAKSKKSTSKMLTTVIKNISSDPFENYSL